MGEQDTLRGDGKLQLVDDQNGPSTSDKLASFGRSLFQHGKTLVDGVQKQAGNIDFKDLAAQAEDKLQHADLGAIAQKAGGMVRGMDTGNLASVAGAAAGIGFPQLAILNRGSSELGDVIAHKQAKALLDDPKKLSDKLLTRFDEFDREKSGYLDDAKLRRFDGLTGIGSEDRAVAQIFRSGYTTFNSLDGDASKKGISRKDIEVFSMMQDRDLLNDYVKKTAFDHGLAWGAVGAGAGAAATYFGHAGMEFSMAAAKSVPLGRLAAAAAIGAIAVGGVADLISRHSQNNFYDEKGKEVDRMIQSMKNSF